MSLYKISFSQKLDADNEQISNETILKKFHAVLHKEKRADRYELGSHSLKIKNDLIRFKFGVDFWFGVPAAAVNIEKVGIYDREITYTINIFPIALLFLIELIFVIYFILTTPVVINAYIFPLFIFVLATMVPWTLVLIRHKTTFNKIIKSIIQTKE
ncbi:MAG: hypothetical protein C0592_01505 [Marinilabiliales bacterium]|nr:MAG: hypothetical protein C0592_01505 [Marinilabiliales bacterium]